MMINTRFLHFAVSAVVVAGCASSIHVESWDFSFPDTRFIPPCESNGRGAELAEGEDALERSLKTHFETLVFVRVHNPDVTSTDGHLSRSYIERAKHTKAPGTFALALAYLGTEGGYVMVLRETGVFTQFCVIVEKHEHETTLVPRNMGSTTM